MNSFINNLIIKIDLAQAITVALVHDWCKINLYTEFQKNVKNDVTGNWDSITAYRHNSDFMIPLGHSEASLWMAQKFFKVNLEMASAIRWHMGKWRACDDEKNELQYANEKFPLVHLIQFADQLSLVKYL